MMQANYLKILDESTSVRFVVNKLDDNRKYRRQKEFHAAVGSKNDLDP